jgi:outer membrane immunogenic protein
VKKRLLPIAALLAMGMSPALADELPVAPSFYVTGPTSQLPWYGFYVGLNGGYGWGNSEVAFAPANSSAVAQPISSADFHRDGALAGGQIGWNWQFNGLWLAGIEGDYQWSDFQGSTTIPFSAGGGRTIGMNVSQSLKSFGTVRARMGVIPLAPLLLYGTAGLAFGNTEANFGTALGSFAGSSSQTKWGWTAGAGAEYALTNSLTLKSEILYVHLGAPGGIAVAQSSATTGVPALYSADLSAVTFVIARGGLNFRF